MAAPLVRTIEAVCTGTARPFNGAELSAIAKYPRDERVQVLTSGLAPDEQADRRHHGGPDMAVHLYPLDHHSYWRAQIGAHDLLDQPGAFGSNLAVSGVTEEAVHIGDRFRLGTALVEISQPRKPCWKIEHRFGHKGMVARIVETARCGWYFRVIEAGDVAAGDQLERVSLGDTRWHVARAFHVLHGSGAQPSDLAELAQVPALSAEMRARAAAKSAT
ncbi:MOSC domain-containing protein [Erythrobacter sp. T5W1-R]|uniref:MOSC domain-containing protein n=1 Tax=Erythrobacter sp. T5W1-R TaxID=3101752 RepID=UPI002AFEE856|nr:MOSC domain-containing protein [Erythrobacter sp. T5W1-R]MEA1619768.1 MOSC domain-containing protein [Erythrobacter sp. T5W1-R]